MKKGVVATLFGVGGVVLGALGVGKTLKKKVDYKSKMSEKHLALYLMMNQWVKVKQENKSIADYLKAIGYEEIAIYGMNYVGETLIDELADSSIKVKYGIDKNANAIYSNIDVVTPDDELDSVDAVIVTAITFFDEIEESLSEKVDCPILSLEDILNEI